MTPAADRLLGQGTTKKHRADAKRQRTSNIAHLVTAMFAGDYERADSTLNVYLRPRREFGEKSARAIEGRLGLPMGALEREDFGTLFPKEKLRKVPGALGVPFTMFDLAQVRARRLELLVGLQVVQKWAKLRASHVGRYLRPRLRNGHMLNGGMPAGEARWLEEMLALPKYWFDLDLDDAVHARVVAAAVAASTYDLDANAWPRRRAGETRRGRSSRDAPDLQVA